MFSLYSRIVVAYDQSELSKRALETAMKMASQDERIALDVITVVMIPTTAYYSAYSYNFDPLRKAYLTAAEEELQEIQEKLKAIPNPSRALVFEGNPAEVLLHFAKENEADLIVMGSRGLSNMKELFLGSVSHYVVQKATCPVFIVK
ncbi:universal stress protein [Ammoniphilus sp. YIM 78166]|uniref:universal stress protein n=1 Tax=Ammoniphilus sp. YIM 78166 TaxID=1644106 RepID=UPI00106F7373|nr:universal stress protein [Ammoniphilus sp. YIM 78166]